MKKKTIIDRYTLSLIKENLVYLLLLLINVVLLIIVNNLFRENILKKQEEIEKAKSEIKIYSNLKNQIDNLNLSTQKLDEYYQLVSIILPQEQNIFSIIAAVERLSTETNFNIINYEISPPAEESSQFTLRVIGQGQSSRFLQFLRKYNFGSGRLITARKINYQEDAEIQAVDLTFYSQPFEPRQDPLKITLPSQQDLEYIENIASKIKFVFDETTEEDYFYPTKDKLF